MRAASRCSFITSVGMSLIASSSPAGTKIRSSMSQTALGFIAAGGSTLS